MVECLNIPFFGIKKEGLNINKQNIFESSIFNHRMILTTINYNIIIIIFQVLIQIKL